MFFIFRKIISVKQTCGTHAWVYRAKRSLRRSRINACAEHHSSHVLSSIRSLIQQKLEAEDRADVKAPVCGVDVVVMGQEEETGRSANAIRIASRTLIADEYLLDCDPKGKVIREANIAGDHSGRGEVEVAVKAWTGNGCGRGSERTGVTGKARSQ